MIRKMIAEILIHPGSAKRLRLRSIFGRDRIRGQSRALVNLSLYRILFPHAYPQYQRRTRQDDRDRDTLIDPRPGIRKYLSEYKNTPEHRAYAPIHQLLRNGIDGELDGNRPALQDFTKEIII